jgi:ubiquinone/menaquinone biosynthesis C-methylase UbiE
MPEERFPGESMLDESIRRYYALGLEKDRLSSHTSNLERLRTESILRRHLPRPPSVICDVGGAAGVYAFPLAKVGYLVHLIDPMELHIQQARELSSKSQTALASMSLGDARKIDMPAASVDAVLFLGPLYHLAAREDRLQALHEAHRILKPGGLLFAAAISRFASFIDGLSSGFFADDTFRKIVRGDLISGRHHNPTNSADYFTTAYFHRPEELRAEVLEANFLDARLIAIEGPVWGAANIRSAMADATQLEVLLSMLSSIEEEPSIVGASAHFIALARKRPSI